MKVCLISHIQVLLIPSIRFLSTERDLGDDRQGRGYAVINQHDRCH